MSKLEPCKLRPIDYGKIKYLLIDKFAGFGGVTTGAMNAGNTIVIAAINHDEHAILSHHLNHGDVTHFNEDITEMYGRVEHGIFFMSPQMKRLIREVDIYRALYPNAKLVMHDSPDCTNYSKSKGGQPRDADSRSLAKHNDRYIYALDPDIVTLENVIEFMSWGPMRVVCKKIHKEDPKNGIYANSELKFVFNKKKKREVYAMVPVSKENGKDYLRWVERIKSFGYNYDWRKLNAADFGSHTSRERLFIMFAKPGIKIAWPTPTHSKNPTRTQTLFGDNLKPWRPVKECINFKNEGNSIFNRKKRHADNTLEAMYAGLLREVKGKKVNDFLFKYYGNGHNLNSLDSPAGTITTKDRFGKVCCILRDYKSAYTTSVRETIGALPTVPKAHLLSFIFNPSHFGHTTSTERSGPVIIARQDKAPLSIAVAESGLIAHGLDQFFDAEDWAIIENQDRNHNSIRIKIVEFMIEHGISDIKMRMLEIEELLLIQGFPVDYKMVGSVQQRKKYIGNSVVPLVYMVMLIALEQANFDDEYREAA